MYSGVGAAAAVVGSTFTPAEKAFQASLNADATDLKMILDFCENIRASLTATISGGSVQNYAEAKVLMYGIGTAMIKYAGAMDAQFSGIVTNYPAEHRALVGDYVAGTNYAQTWLTSKLPAVYLPVPLNPDLTYVPSVTVTLPKKR